MLYKFVEFSHKKSELLSLDKKLQKLWLGCGDFLRYYYYYYYYYRRGLLSTAMRYYDEFVKLRAYVCEVSK